MLRFFNKIVVIVFLFSGFVPQMVRAQDDEVSRWMAVAINDEGEWYGSYGLTEEDARDKARLGCLVEFEYRGDCRTNVSIEIGWYISALFCSESDRQKSFIAASAHDYEVSDHHAYVKADDDGFVSDSCDIVAQVHRASIWLAVALGQDGVHGIARGSISEEATQKEAVALCEAKQGNDCSYVQVIDSPSIYISGARCLKDEVQSRYLAVNLESTTSQNKWERVDVNVLNTLYDASEGYTRDDCLIIINESINNSQTSILEQVPQIRWRAVAITADGRARDLTQTFSDREDARDAAHSLCSGFVVSCRGFTFLKSEYGVFIHCKNRNWQASYLGISEVSSVHAERKAFDSVSHDNFVRNDCDPLAWYKVYD